MPTIDEALKSNLDFWRNGLKRAKAKLPPEVAEIFIPQYRCMRFYEGFRSAPLANAYAYPRGVEPDL